MTKKALNKGMVGVVMGGLAACSPVGPGSAPAEPVWTPEVLLDSQWIEAGPPVGPRPVSLDIAPDAQISGSTGCNHYMGKAEITVSSVRFHHNASTRMFCFPQALMDTENRFWEALSKTRSAKTEQGLLLLLDEAGQVLWRFKPRD